MVAVGAAYAVLLTLYFDKLYFPDDCIMGRSPNDDMYDSAFTM